MEKSRYLPNVNTFLEFKTGENSVDLNRSVTRIMYIKNVKLYLFQELFHNNSLLVKHNNEIFFLELVVT